MIQQINSGLAKLAGGRVLFIDPSPRFSGPDRGVRSELYEKDLLHLALPGYQEWAEMLRPHLLELLGPPAAEDFAPPPTGDPSARRK